MLDGTCGGETMTNSTAEIKSYWSQPLEQVRAALRTHAGGLSSAEAGQRLDAFGPNALQVKEQVTPLRLFLEQFRSPLVLILVFAGVLSATLREWVDATIVLLIVLVSAFLGFLQEYNASAAMKKLRARVMIKANVVRDGRPQPIPATETVPGDEVLLSAGSLVPADGVVLEAKDFFVNQAVLTGETFPVEKSPGTVSGKAALRERTNCVFMGTSVRTGSARALIVRTGASTEYGQISKRLSLRPPETEFERGIRQFGTMLTQVMFVMVLAVFAINVYFQEPVVDSLLFAVALAVGMSPELLPAIISITLSKGAQTMANHGVIVRRLVSIENFGSMDVLCTDKTGTLTEGVVQLDGALDAHGQPSDEVLRYAFWNAHFQSGLTNPLDEAILAAGEEKGPALLAQAHKADEIPYDFVRKRLSVVVHSTASGANPETTVLVTKGALQHVLAVCSDVWEGGSVVPLTAERLEEIEGRFTAWSGQGYRVLGVATKPVPLQEVYSRGVERALAFAGFLLFFDPPKPGVHKVLSDLAGLGVQLKIITGDNRLVAQHTAHAVGMKVAGVVTGAQLDDLQDEALWNVAERTNLFVEVDPNQKERIILALQRMGHVVGYMGDGINDAPALHDADVGISVEKAVDVAKEAADFVLLKRDLDVLCQGIVYGRNAFANSLKYVFTTNSANFGNMFSMAGASLFMPFLPLLPKQILLNNLLSDLPSTAIAADTVDPELTCVPRRWDIKFIRDSMITFGLVSSIFDYATFAILLYVVRASPAEFRTGWFIESLLTELFITLVLRTRRPFFRSKPGRELNLSVWVVFAVAVILPYTPVSAALGFVPLPLPLMLTIMGITAAYLVASELVKQQFYARRKG
jgi:Mg2+-importing ATPase